MVSYGEWDTSLIECNDKLNTSDASCIFEVGASQTLIVFEIGGFVGPDQMKELIDGASEPDHYGVIHDIKPGIWAVSEGSGSEEPPFIATWVSDGHINYNALPQMPLISPLNLDGVEWKKVDNLSYNLTVGCLLALENAQEFEQVGMNNAISSLEDLGGVIPGGFIFGPHESAQELDVHVQNGEVVQLRVDWRELEPLS